MNWLYEDSTPAIVVGVIVVALLLLALVKTQRRGFLWGIVGMVLLTTVIVLIEKNTVTDTKLIRSTLDRGVAALKRNDLPALLAIISTDRSAAQTRNSATSVAHEIQVDDASISGVKIEVNRAHTPPMATAELTGHLSGKLKSATALYPYDHFPPQHIRIFFRWEDGRWLIESYENVER